MVCPGAGEPLRAERRPLTAPQGQELLARVLACAVCRTDLHVVDGELPEIPYPIVPGHQVVADVVATGPQSTLAVGQRIGVPWLAATCGECRYCRAGQENLCDHARFTGYQRDGGYAEYLVADSRYCLPLSAGLPPAETTPLLCAGLIGYRTLRMAGDAHRIGIYGFGSAAHLVTQVARRQGREILAFTRPGDGAAQDFARELGASWAGDSDQPAPAPLDAALIFAPVGALVPQALRQVRKGGQVVCGGIHMSDIPSFPYADLWGERQIRSVANLTRQDGREFMALAAEAGIETRITRYPLADANRALDDLRCGRLQGTAVLLP
ncbi:MAG: zinc-binding alcohol dehydrogenase family protein [Gammaproteobacteria bacterium]|nr:MAG: zinc-binding alcohol dehydrogenase family protein [Gammaproteobacteria bacterium]